MVYQLYHIETGKVMRESKAMAPCKRWIREIADDYGLRSVVKIRVVEFVPQVIAEIKPEENHFPWMER